MIDDDHWTCVKFKMVLQKVREYEIELNPGTYSFDSKKEPKIIITYLDENEFEFEIINIHTSLVNALRRIMLSEIPTMAIEKVLIQNNTSFIHDETLSLRLGLIPIKIDPSSFNFHTMDELETQPETTLIFELKVRGRKIGEIDQESEYTLVDKEVYSHHLKWIPIEYQSEIFASDPPRPVEDNILLVKLSPGQIIDLRVYCRKGIGQDHAKFSPVATASYRMMPYIKLLSVINGEKARRLQSYFSPGVIDLVNTPDGDVKAVVAGSFRDSINYNVTRDKDLKNLVEIGRISDHFLFKIESIGCVPPFSLIKTAFEILYQKCERHLNKANYEKRAS